MNENPPERWKHEFGLGSAKTQNWLPYSYFTDKSKCYKAEGRVCEKKGHLCVRKIVAYTKVAETRGLATGWKMYRKVSESVWRRLGGLEIEHSPRRSSHRNEIIAVKSKTRSVRAVSKIERDGVWPGV